MDRTSRARIKRTMWFYRIMLDLLSTSIPLLRKVSRRGAPAVYISNEVHRQFFTAGSVPCEWQLPASSSNTAVVLYLHGGGGVVELLDSERSMVAHLSKLCRLRFLCPDYRLAPENPFPAGLEDCLAVYRWMLSNDFASDKIAIAGSSAGGLLTITLLLAIREARLPLPAAAVCISPNTDPTCSGASIRKNRFRDALLSPRYLRTMMKLYSGSHDPRDPLLNPLYADLHDLPPMLVQVGEDELLLDDSIRFSAGARAAGMNITLEIWPHMWHVWHNCVPDLPDANLAIETIARYIHAQLAAKEHLQLASITT